MKHRINIKAHIADMQQKGRFAVLVTEGNGQPNASLIAITPIEGFKSLILATYRNICKYRNILQNRKLAVLIEGIAVGETINPSGWSVITAFGYVEEITKAGTDW